MDVKKVLFVSQEIDPYLPGTPVAGVSRSMAQMLQEKGAEVRCFMPRYGAINERRNQLHEVIRLSGLNIEINNTDHPLIIKVATLQPSRLQVYFIDNDDYFFRHGQSKSLETEEQAEINDERAIFFVRGVIETVKKLRWNPDIVVCCGWVSSLVPIYLRTIYAEDPAFAESKIVYAIAGKPFEGQLNPQMVDKLKDEGLTDEQISKIADKNGIIDFEQLNRLAIDASDAIVDSGADSDNACIEYAKASGKPLLSFCADTDAKQQMEFYQSL